MTDRSAPRLEEELRRELLGRAAAIFGPTADAIEPREMLHAILSAGARIGEEVSRRLALVPEKQADNFYTAMGLSRLAARPASMPVAYVLGDSTDPPPLALAGSRIGATAGEATVNFETNRSISLVHGKVTTLAAIGLAGDKADSIYLAPPAVLNPVLPWRSPIPRLLPAGAVAGAEMVQIEPPDGLAASSELRIGADDYAVTKLDGTLATLSPALNSGAAEGSDVREVLAFAPFSDEVRNRQAHHLHLAHSALLNLPSASTITISGLSNAPASLEWAWFGKITEDGEPGWQPMASARFDATGRWVLEKPDGKPEKTEVGGTKSYWLRATLADKSTQIQQASDLQLALGASGSGCADSEDEIGGKGVDFEAVAVTTPAVTSKPFHPFGTEPRTYDCFYIGCEEIFGKPGARARLSFKIGGADLGKLAIAASAAASTFHVFGVGTDGQLYRAMPGVHQRLEAIRPPIDLPAGFARQAPVAAAFVNAGVTVAIGGQGTIDLAVLDPSNQAPTLASWSRLAGDEKAADQPARAVAILADHDRTVLARFGDRVLSWSGTGMDRKATPVEGAFDLLPLDGAHSGEAIVLLKLEVKDGDGQVIARKVVIEHRSASGPPATIGQVQLADLPELMRYAALSGTQSDGTVCFIGGWSPDPEQKGKGSLRVVRSDGAQETIPGATRIVPVSLEPSLGESREWPGVTIADGRIVSWLYDDGWIRLDGEDIGDSSNTARQVVVAANWVLLHAASQGLLARPAADRNNSLGARMVEGRVALASGDPDLADCEYLVRPNTANGTGFALLAQATGQDRLLEPLGATPPVLPDPQTQAWDEAVIALTSFPGAAPAVLRLTGNTLELVNQPFDDHASGTEASWAFVLVTQQQRRNRRARRSLWRLDRIAGTDKWELPHALTLRRGEINRYMPLEPAQLDSQGEPAAIRLQPGNSRLGIAIEDSPESLFGTHARLQVHGLPQGLRTVIDQTAFAEFGTNQFAPSLFALASPDGQGMVRLLLSAEPQTWQLVGPSQPANPDLSWEYWDGSAWWTLDSPGLKDTTADLLRSGNIWFDVPANLAETEVLGRMNRWIRARLVGGDYGHPRISSRTKPDPAVAGGTISEVIQDHSAIRAPTVTELKLSYCTRTSELPEAVVSEDNLAHLNQTGANSAGLPVRLFAPAATLFSGSPPSGGEAEGERGDCCEFPVPPAATGQTVAAAALPFDRCVLLGLSHPAQGDAVSLWFDAEPRPNAFELRAQLWRDGGFTELEVLSDTTSGLSEPGIVTLGMPQSPDLAQLLGRGAYWIALGPKDRGESWQPALRAVYPNAAMAESIETRRNEVLGTSTGAPKQVFRLVATPVDPGSLELFVNEPLGEADAKALGALDEIEGRSGRWIAWKRQGEFATGAGEPPDRHYLLDAETGQVRFGDGHDALVPPVGSTIMARSYRAVTGDVANGVEAGAELQNQASLAGVEKVLALRASAGGTPVETSAAARARAPAILCTGNRLVTLADIEQFVLAAYPLVAQARAANRGTAIRLVVAMRGPEILPAPAMLRAIHENIAGSAAYGIAAQGRLQVVAPRLAPIGLVLGVGRPTGVDVARLQGDARKRLVALLDHESGGLDGRGWPVGAAPRSDEIYAALDAIAPQIRFDRLDIRRLGSGGALPDPLPGDVQVRLEAEAIVFSTAELAA